jgi:succinoglycan biosynthesis protein ExoM
MPRDKMKPISSATSEGAPGRSRAPARAASEPESAEAIDAVAVTVCVCTFRRPSLLAAIESVAAQILPTGTLLHILVVDNDFDPSAEAIVEGFRARNSCSLEYRHAPGRNISAARNEGLRCASTPWLAFIDDDEYAPPNWLADLLAARRDAHAVFGPCEAIYPQDAPRWMKAGDYHSNRIPARKGKIDTGYTSNVLIDMNFVRRNILQFDPALGRTGGEDTFFFQAMYRRGAVLRYAPQAVVYEEVAASRLNLKWILRRKFRAGQVYALMFLRFDAPTYRRWALTAPFKIAACAAMFALTAFDLRRAMRWLVRGTFHVGMLNYILGGSVYQEYRDAPWPASLSRTREVE